MDFKKFIGNLGDFLKKSRKRYLHFVAIVSSFCGVSERSVENWFDGVFFPKGITLLKFREVFANSVLYNLEDMKVLPKELRLFAKLIAHGKITVEDACKEIGFSSKDELLRPLTGFRFPGKERMQKIQSLVEKSGNQLNEASMAVYGNFSEFETLFAEVANTGAIPPVPAHSKTVKPKNLINALGGIRVLISAAKGDIAALHNGSPEDRQSFRNDIGTKEFFDISNEINEFYDSIVPFSSETAYERRVK